ncbi:dirigent protein 22-like [Zingiber officinale]|uniref:dirigent protein 22-like n=1 Tax=Zingiber officinale TaxID=94328 RepID=UPI001C4B50A2|nr:dirigent protein 22-like [Zingiber officinale]
MHPFNYYYISGVKIMASSASSSSSFLLLFALFAAAATASHHHHTRYMHLRFYNHERILGSGPNATVVYAVERTISSTGAGFGNIIVYDNLLRAGVETDSPIIGRNQGMGVGSSLAQNSGLTNFQLVFTAGEYKGSSLALQGLFPVAPLGTVFERAITGGTGKFRLARGYLLTVEVRSTNTTLTGQLDAYITFR